MARAGAVFIDVLPSMAGWNTAVRAQAAVSLEGVGAATGKGFTAGLMRAVKGGNMASVVGAQARAAADQAAIAVEQASRKVAMARKREADASGAVRVAEMKLTELRAKESTSASTLAGAEERLARAQRTQAAAAEGAVVANKGLVAAQATAAERTAALGAESTVAAGRFSAMGAAVTGGAARMTSRLGGLAKGVAAMGGLFAGFELARFAGESVHAAMDFQKGSQVLQTAAGELPKNLAMVRSGLMAISSETGTTLDQMTEGMYTVEKAGIRGAKGLDVMRAAAKGAKDEGADLGIVTNALTTVMTTSNGKITNASKAMNAVMVAAGHSKTTLQEFAGSLSSVLPLASKVGIGFDQVSGAISTMTAQGMSAQQSTQDLNHVIAALATPSKIMSTEMSVFGIESDKVRDKLGKRGLQGTIEYLSAAIKSKMGPASKQAIADLKKLPAPAQALADQYQHGLLTSSQFTSKVGKLKVGKADAPQAMKDTLLAAAPAMRGYTQALSKMTGGQMGLTTSLMLTGENGKLFAETTKDVGKAVNSTADFDKKWGISSKTTANQLAIAKQSISNVGTALATQMLPGIGKAAEKFASATMVVSKFTKQNWSWLGPVAKGLSLVTAALVAWSILTKITLWIKALTIWQAIAAVSTKAWSAAQWLLTASTSAAGSAIETMRLRAMFAQDAMLRVSKAALTAAASMVKTGVAAAANGVRFIAMKVAMLAVAAASKVWAAAQWVLNAALDANPISLIIIAIAALVAGFILAYTKVGWFHSAVNAAFHGIGVAIDFIKEHWKIFLTGFLLSFGPLGIAIALIVTHFQTFKTVATAVFKAIIDSFLGLVGYILDGAAKAFGWVPGLGGKLKSAAASFDNFRDRVNAALDGIHAQKDIYLNVTTKQIVLNPSISKPRVVHPWTGGRIIGPGTGTSDSIPAMVSNGEYVIKAAAVDHYGAGMFDQLNSMRYASGGRVVGRLATPLATRHAPGGVDLEQSVYRGTSRALADSHTVIMSKDDLHDLDLLVGTA